MNGWWLSDQMNIYFTYTKLSNLVLIEDFYMWEQLLALLMMQVNTPFNNLFDVKVWGKLICFNNKQQVYQVIEQLKGTKSLICFMWDYEYTCIFLHDVPFFLCWLHWSIKFLFKGLKEGLIVSSFSQWLVTVYSLQQSLLKWLCFIFPYWHWSPLLNVKAFRRSKNDQHFNYWHEKECFRGMNLLLIPPFLLSHCS